MTRINPTRDLYRVLQRVEYPARYVGGEWGTILGDAGDSYRIALTFPELYEVGMSNTAIKILYGLLNELPGVRCERVFVPAPDFESELSLAGVPLYTLETGMPLDEVDLLAVSFGYELLATNVLTILQSGNIPIRSDDRAEGDPIVVFGGPGATNPIPYAPFVDAVFIGEAEGVVPELVEKLATLKKRGATRADQLDEIHRHPSMWYPGRTTVVRRAIWNGFGGGGRRHSFGAGFPVPSMPIVQDHGVVEIMRGCPQGCRFCHAGIFYRPYRMKRIDDILEEVRWLVETQGYREISLSSLSTGDYGDLLTLTQRLTSVFGPKGVSFSLPSLRVNSVTLPILELVSRGKRSGLTFAVESADTTSQAAINKLVPLSRVQEIAREARARGWKHAKLYFMIGLPVPEMQKEAEKIADYVHQLRQSVPMEYIVNVGTFVPKPHTPFQWAEQLNPETALQHMETIRGLLPRGTKLRAHDPYNSWLEGLLSRGNADTAELIMEAHRRGARLDAWDEHANIKLWQDIVAEPEFQSRVTSSLGPFGIEQPLPWSGIHLGVTKAFLKQENERSSGSTLTDRCAEECIQPCGVCNKTVRVREVKPADEGHDQTVGALDSREISILDSPSTGGQVDEDHGRSYQLVIQYKKTGRAAFLPHLALVRVFERVWNRIDLPLALTQGYHKKPKMSFGQPLPLGSESEDELVIVNVSKNIHVDTYYQKLCDALPDGFFPRGALLLHHEKGSQRIPSPMQKYCGSVYSIEWSGDDVVSKDKIEDVSIILRGYGLSLTEDSFLPTTAPGIGRILKELPAREDVTVRRRKMYAAPPDRSNGLGGVGLFEFYRNLPNCIGYVDANS